MERKYLLGEKELVTIGLGPDQIIKVIEKGETGDTAISQLIRNGVTDKTPSEDAVFDVLLTKLNADGTNKLTVGTVEPTDPEENDLWIDTN